MAGISRTHLLVDGIHGVVEGHEDAGVDHGLGVDVPLGDHGVQLVAGAQCAVLPLDGDARLHRLEDLALNHAQGGLEDGVEVLHAVVHAQDLGDSIGAQQARAVLLVLAALRDGGRLVHFLNSHLRVRVVLAVAE
jgi:hypothetical protein